MLLNYGRASHPGYIERWFCLKGNLLFCMKGTDRVSISFLFTPSVVYRRLVH